MHRHGRSGSMSYLEGLHPGPELGLIRPVTGTPNIVDADVFPPSRSQAPDPSIFLPYITEDIAFEEEYEEYLSDLGWSDNEQTDGPLFGGTSAWHRLPAFAADIGDGISDSESIASIGELGDDARLDPSRDDPEVVDENLNNWEVRCRLGTTAGGGLTGGTTAHESQDDGGTAQVAGGRAAVEPGRGAAAGAAVWAGRRGCGGHGRRGGRGRAGTYAPRADRVHVWSRGRRGGVCLRVSDSSFLVPKEAEFAQGVNGECCGLYTLIKYNKKLGIVHIECCV